MSDVTIDVTREYKLAEEALKDFNPGIYPDTGKLMRASYVHGYAKALIDQRTLQAAFDYMLPFVHVDIRDKALQIARGESQPEAPHTRDL